jgi:hypothetical protein
MTAHQTSIHRRVLAIIILTLCSGCLAMCAETTVHVVERSETLRSIAPRYGASVSALAGQRGLTSTGGLHAGQQSGIPPRPPTRQKSSLSPPVERAIKAARVQPGRWQHIVVHHSGTDFGTVKGMDRYHREERHMENGLAYHFVIGNGRGLPDGEVAIGRRWVKQLDGGHLAIDELNRISLGICLIGNFEKDRPTVKQMASLKALVTSLLERCALKASAVTTHRQIHPHHTECPGRNFPAKQFLGNLK